MLNALVVYKVYKGAHLDLELYKNKLVNEYAFDVYKDSGASENLTIYQDVTLAIYQKPHGTLVVLFNKAKGIKVSDAIYWTALQEQVNIRPKFYYYECFGTLASQQQELIFKGQIPVI